MASDESMGGFGSGMIWIFGIIVLLALLNGNFLGGGNNQTATRDQVQGSFEYSNLLDGNRDIMTAVNSGTAQAVAATNQAKYDNINVAKDIENMVLSQIGEVKVAQAQALANANECCCATKQMILEKSAQTDAEIAQLKYDNALGLAGLEQRLTAKMDANTIDALRQRVSQLELREATCGIPRLTASYPGYIVPFFPPFPAPTTTTTGGTTGT